MSQEGRSENQELGQVRVKRRALREEMRQVDGETLMERPPMVRRWSMRRERLKPNLELSRPCGSGTAQVAPGSMEWEACLSGEKLPEEP